MRSIRTTLWLLLLAGAFTLAEAQTTAPEPRTALVIGNADYAYGALANPLNDAQDMALALRDAGFEVVLKLDADLEEMRGGIQEFASKLKEKGGAGFFYFAGHGLQLEGENYLLPVGGGRIKGEEDIKNGAVTASEVVDAMAAARNGLNIVVLDACRDNPISKRTRGLSRIDSNAYLFVSYSTSPGAVALDGEGRNSPYTKHLASAISTPGLSLEETFKRTLKGVYQETSGLQTPWMASSFFGDFAFRPTAPATVALAPPPQQPAEGLETEAVVRPLAIPKEDASPALDLSGVYRVSGTNPDGSNYTGMLTLTQSGPDFTLTWWIGKQIFHCDGHLAGKMLVVNWGAKHPVIYSFAGGGLLDGEWADGTATESLALVARAAPGPIELVPGTYDVTGRNPNGTSYQGVVEIGKSGSTYDLSWRIGESHYSGTGTLKNNVLTVDWGSATPVVYALTADGSLKGLWDAGQGEETLTPNF